MAPSDEGDYAGAMRSGSVEALEGTIGVPAEQAIALHDAVASTEVGVLDGLSMDHGQVCGKWRMDNDETALVVAEFGREPVYTVDSFRNFVQSAEDCTCAILLSVAHRIQGTKRVHITEVGTKPVVVISRAIDDPMPALSLMQYGLTTLHQIVTSSSRVRASVDPEAGGIDTAVPLQDWESAEGALLVESLLEYRRLRERFPEKSTFHGRFMRSLPDEVQEFVSYNENTYAIVKERIREYERDERGIQSKRKREASINDNAESDEHTASHAASQAEGIDLEKEDMMCL